MALLQPQPTEISTSVADMLRDDYEVFELMIDNDGNLPDSIELALIIIPQGSSVRKVDSIEELPAQCTDEAFCDTGHSVWNRYQETVYSGQDGKIVRQTSIMKLTPFDAEEPQYIYFVIQSLTAGIIQHTAAAIENL